MRADDDDRRIPWRLPDRGAALLSRPLHPHVHAARAPDRAAQIVAETGEVTTFAELERHSNQAAQLFRRLGLRRGDAIALYADNHPRYLELCWAAQRSGLYYIPLSWRLTAAEVNYILRDAGVKLLIIADQFAGMVAQLDPVPILTIGGAVAGLPQYEPLRNAAPAARLADESCGSDMLYTSGTTGQPKGVRRPLPDGPIDRVPPDYDLYLAMGYGEGIVHYSPGPMYHASPLRVAMMAQALGGTVLIGDHFDAEQSLAFIARYRVTHSNWVPTHFVRLLKLDPAVRTSYDTSSLRLVIHGAAPCPVEIKRRLIEWLGPIVLEYYGGTEQFGGCMISSQEWLAHPGSVGRSIGGAIHIVDLDSGRELPTGATGAIYFEGPPAVGYHNAPEKDRKARDARGWATFGDIGHLDADGYLYLSDRQADMIISGGVNVYPQEAEQRLTMHDQVADVAVFGIPNEDFGEEVKAVVQPVHWQDAGPMLAEQLISFCREALSPIKCPRSIEFQRELPRLENGKLYKRKLRERYVLDDETHAGK